MSKQDPEHHAEAADMIRRMVPGMIDSQVNPKIDAMGHAARAHADARVEALQAQLESFYQGARVASDRFLLFTNDYGTVTQSFAVHNVYEDEIYGTTGGNRMRVVAFLYPQLLRDYQAEPVHVFCLVGNHSSDPGAEDVNLFAWTRDYAISAAKTSGPSFQRPAASGRTVTRHEIHRDPSHSVWELYWGHDVTDSQVLAKTSGAQYRVTSLLLPGALRELDLGVWKNIRCFGYQEGDTAGAAAMLSGVTLRDVKIKDVAAGSGR